MASDPTAVALQLVAAVTAARRTGMVPVVGLLSADQVADLNDLTTTANLVQQGIAEAAAAAEEVQSFAPMVAGGVGGGSTMPSGAQTPASTVGVAPPDLALSSTPTTPKKAPPPVPKDVEAATPARRPVMKAPPQVPATTWRVTPLDQLPRKAAPTSTTTSGTSTPAHVQVKPMPQRRLPTSPRATAAPSTPAAPMAPMPSAPPTPAQNTGGETPADYFATPAAKARAAARLAAGADPFDATLSMIERFGEIRAALNVQTEAMAAVAPSTASTRPTSPKAQGKAPPEALMPPTTLMAPEPTPAADHQYIDPDLGIPAVTTVVADTFLDTPLEPTVSAQDFLGPAPPPRPFFNLTTASTTRSPTPPSPRVDPPAAASASDFLGAASAGVPAPGPMTTVPEEDRPEPWEMPSTQRRSVFPPVTAEGTGGRNMRAPSAAHRRGSVGPSPGQRAQWRRDARSQDERRQYGAYDSRRWGGAEPWTAEQVDIPAEYYPYKVSMERRGASALGEVVPSSLRHLACDDLAAVRQKEQAAQWPETAPRGAQTETDYYFIRRLPQGVAGARITVQHSKEQRRLVGWCAHPCQQPRGDDNRCDGEGRSALSLAPPDEAERLPFGILPRRPRFQDPRVFDGLSTPCTYDDATAADMAQDASAPQPGTFAAFLAEVAAAGGQAHMQVFAELGVTSRALVGPAGPALAAAGVPEQVILELVRPALTGPAPSALVPRRADLPYRRPVAKASLQASLQAAAPQNIQQAVDALEANVVAASTRRALDSRIKFWLKLAATNGVEPWPLTPWKLKVLAACLREGGYRSAQLYIDAVLWHQEHVLQTEVPTGMRKEARRLAKAAVRGMPGTRLKQAFDLGVLAAVVRFGPADGPLDCRRPHHAVDVVIVASWFMLRESELAGARVRDITLSAAVTKAASVEMFGLVLGTAGVETHHTTPDGRSLPIFGGHSARVAGATFLAARGVAVAVIQLLGRWSSSAVERYTQSAPLTYAAAAVPAQALATTPVDQPTAKAQPAAPQYPAIADVDRESSWEVVAPPDAQSEEDGLAGVAFVPAPLRAEAVANIVGEAPTVYIMNSRTRVVHLPGPDEAGLERHEWAASLLAYASSLDCRRSPRNPGDASGVSR
ncbi:unnamed protein product [Symbiodinium necroappetens]|uniref:Uncharacterized protein n=1 Tax=Symbiodinium necroappetens TaxID=1628268 RepID=A0A812QLC3_9DINO|nr:unnamed protein product [Symbiodinium necroappetens]